MLRSKLRSFILVLALTCSAVFSQYNRDEVIQLTFPTTGAIIDMDSVVVAFDLAPFFALGEPNCADCDGYIAVYLNQELQGTVNSGNSYIISNLIDGEYFLELEAVNPNGESFNPVVHDTVTFFVDWEENYCPPSDLIVNSTVQYEALFLKWQTPGGSATYFEDFKDDYGDYVSNGDWEWGQPSSGPMSAYSGEILWGVSLAGDYITNSNATLDSPPINLAGFSTPQLVFWHWYYTETPYDGGNVKISTDDGMSWNIIYPSDGYDIDAASSWNAGIPGEPCFSGHNQGFWEEAIFDLTDYSDEEVIFRWHFRSDESVQYPGWYIDAVSVGDPDERIVDRVDIPTCGDLLRYEIYKNGTSLTSVDTTNYIDTAVVLGQEYCFYVKAVYDSSGFEIHSDSTNHACGLPESFIPALPSYLQAVTGDEEIALSWAAPNTIFPEGENCINPFIAGDVASGFSQVFTGITDGFENDYTNGLYANGPDVVYQINVLETVDISFSLCGGSTWDTYLMLISGDCNELVAYDDDACDLGLQSYLEGTLTPGIYNVVVDGYGSSSYGDYSLAIDAATPTRTVGFVSNVTNFDKVLDSGFRKESGRDISDSFITPLNDYIANAAQEISFILSVVSPDSEYVDGFSLTFPDDWIISSGWFQENILPVAINGSVITFGDPYANSGWGSLNPDDYIFSVNLIAADTSSDIIVGYYIGGDTYGSDPHFVDDSLILAETTREEYDFTGYNIYVDNVLHNDFPIVSSSYLVTGLENNVAYEFGITAHYYPDYESAPVMVTATPTWLFGDITGLVRDPNGDLLDSAIVTARGVKDTTGNDGIYYLTNIFPGTYTIKVNREGFDRSEAEVTVLAQEAPVTQDFTLIPALARAHGLQAEGGDHTVYLSWRTPGGETDYDLAYYDEFFEAQIGCGSGCEFGVRFTPVGYPAAMQSLLISVQGDASVFDASIIAYLDPDGNGLGPVGDPIFITSGLDLTAVNLELTQYQIDLSAADIAVNSGDIYILIHENNSGFLGIANDFEPQSPEFYDRNWVGIDGEYMTVFDAVGGDPALTGDFGIMASFFGTAGRAAARNISQTGVQIPESYTLNRRNEFSATANPSMTTAQIHSNSNPANVVRLNNVIFPNRPLDVSREDSLVGFTIYQALASGDTLVTSNDGDTTAVISVPEDYTEYCYNVKALWQTESYGVIESSNSADACAVTFTPGEANFDSAVDISDLMAVVDYVLGITIPTADQLRNTDINHDHEINIADIVMIVDIIFGPGPAARKMTEIDGAAIVELKSGAASELKLNLAYEGLIRGMQFKVKYDPSQVELGVPYLNTVHNEVLIASNHDEPGVLSVVILNAEEGRINERTDLINLPYKLLSRNNSGVKVALDEVLVVGTNGHMIPVLKETGQVDIQAIPEQYALHQNFPNPFNPVTEIQFDLPEISEVEITIYNLMGQKVRTLIRETRKPGFHQVIWNGLNDAGISVATGMYFYSLETPAYQMTRKMVLLK